MGHLGMKLKFIILTTRIVLVSSLATQTKHTPINKQMKKLLSHEYFKYIVRNKAAEICEKYLNKGDQVYIEGRLKTRKWQR